jgi:hypothetical protein
VKESVLIRSNNALEVQNTDSNNPSRHTEAREYSVPQRENRARKTQQVVEYTNDMIEQCNIICVGCYL